MSLSFEQQTRLNEISAALGALLKTCNAHIVTAESCTGGGIAQVITAIAGSSSWFNGGFVTYSNEAKTQLLSVDGQLIHDYGAVSQQVVEAMAKGAVTSSLGELSVAVSGIAGPEGGTPEKPVGTVWIGWCHHEQFLHSQKFIFEGDREMVRYQTIVHALEGAIRLLSQQNKKEFN